MNCNKSHQELSAVKCKNDGAEIILNFESKGYQALHNEWAEIIDVSTLTVKKRLTQPAVHEVQIVSAFPAQCLKYIFNSI